jgi:DNA-binding response OmpR family regulator
MPATILIADDNRNIRTIVKMDLEFQGYRVLEATNGQEALDMARDRKPDLVVLDVMMPLLDGFEVCSRMKKEEATRGIPVIMLTAKTTPEDKFLGRESGADEYITKPFDPVDLERVIERILTAREKGEVLHPLTGLPLWAAARHEMATRDARGESYAILEGFLDEAAFDIYQQKYGAIKADEVLANTARILKSGAALFPGFFLGQRGDSVFIFIGTPNDMEGVRSSVTGMMADAIPSFYEPRGRSRFSGGSGG